jgi:pimeloyl-ACP methyl ester carboxylesterase
MSTVELSRGTIHYRETGPASGRPVVFVHGYMMGGELWDGLAERLAEAGLRSLAPTWPLGAHPEPMRPGSELTMESLASLVDEFATTLSLEDAVLVGNDTGGAISQLVAVTDPRWLAGLVLTSCDAFEHFPPPILAPLIRAARIGPVFAAALQPMRTRLGRRQGFAALAHADIDALVRGWVAPALGDRGVREDLRAFTGSLRQETTLEAARRLPECTRPALVAWSADDRFFAVEDGRRLVAALPDARFELIAGARTFSMIDQPDRLAELITEFARGLDPAG